MIQIDTANRILIDGQNTGLAISQQKNETVIYTTAKCLVHKMPHARYSTTHDDPASGVAGRSQLETDIRALLAKDSN